MINLLDWCGPVPDDLAEFRPHIRILVERWDTVLVVAEKTASKSQKPFQESRTSRCNKQASRWKSKTGTGKHG